MNSLPKHMLYPADILVAKEPCLVSTVLGSCVSVCLFDAVTKLGAINHYVLPCWNGHDEATMKYGNLSIIRILEKLLLLGCKHENIVAKIFGGAEVLSGMPTNFHIGRRNVQIANDILNEFGIDILLSDVGGNTVRKIIFNTSTGEVEFELIRKRNSETKKTLKN